MTATDRTLERLLVEAGQSIDWPEAPHLSATVTERIRAGSRPYGSPRWIAVTAAIVVLVTGLLMSSSAMRQAVADLLGVVGIRIEVVEEVDQSLESDIRPGESVDLAEAAEAVAFPIMLPSGGDLPAPDGVFLSEIPPGGQVTLMWDAGDSLPEILDTGVGLLISQFQGRLEEGFVKELGAATTVELVEHGPVQGFWIEGVPHVLQYEDVNGNTRRETSRLAANTLLWESAGVTFRIESNLSLAKSLEIAKILRPIR